MTASADLRSDALVLFGATGDLSAGMIFPALARLLAEDALDLPVVAVGRGAQSAEAIAARVRERIGSRARIPDAWFDLLFRRVRCVNGDVRSPATYDAVRDALRGARRPLHYFAIPEALFATVARSLHDAGLAEGARIAIEKPFGHDLASARAQRREIAEAFPDAAIFHVDHFLAKDPIRNLADMRVSAPWLAPILSRNSVRSVQITMAETFGIGKRGRFYEATGALRDVLQNHLLRLVAIAAMDPVHVADDDGFASSRIETMSAIRPLAPGDVVYGQYDGYRDEPDVAPDSRVPTYVAVRLLVESPRWRGVPFLVRAGKRLALTTTMLTFQLAREDPASSPARVRFRLGPGPVDVAVDTHHLLPGSDSRRAPLVVRASLPPDEDSDAYVNIVRALVDGHHGLFERAEGVFAAWRVVDSLLRETLPVARYAPGTFGPAEASRLLRPGERWIDPEPA